MTTILTFFREQKERFQNTDSIKIGFIALFLSVVFLCGTFFYLDYLFESRMAGDVSSGNGYYSSFMGDVLSPDLYHKTVVASKKIVNDTVLQLYRDEVSKADVVDFYSQITGSEEIAKIILTNSDKNNIPVSLAFSLSWEESRYHSKAVNRNAGSIDRGLFQLNSKSFPMLTEAQFFDPEVSAYYGLAHLNLCIEQAGNIVAALAMYNAGAGKVTNNNTPQRTLNYVSRILNYRDNLNELFKYEVQSKYIIGQDGKISPVMNFVQAGTLGQIQDSPAMGGSVVAFVSR